MVVRLQTWVENVCVSKSACDPEHSYNDESGNVANHPKSPNTGEAIGSHHHAADGWRQAADCRVHRHVQSQHRACVLLQIGTKLKIK